MKAFDSGRNSVIRRILEVERKKQQGSDWNQMKDIGQIAKF